MNEPSNPLLVPHNQTTPPVPQTADELPIINPLGAIDSLLRHPGRVINQLKLQNHRLLVLAFLGTIMICSGIYGLVLGSFSGGAQYWAAPLKASMGLLIATLICLPSLYIFNCLSGSQAKLKEVIGLAFGAVGLVSVLLVGLAPVSWIFSQSTDSILVIAALHLMFLLVALYFGLRFLSRGFQSLSSESSGVLKIWMLIFLVVIFQMTATLRPLIGKPETFFPKGKKFFLVYWGENLAESAKSVENNLNR